MYLIPSLAGLKGSCFPGGYKLNGKFSSSCRTETQLNRIKETADEIESTSKSTKSHRVRDRLPSLKPSYLSLSLVFICVFLLSRNESTNDCLVTLEWQTKVLSTRECCVETGLNTSPKEGSGKPRIVDSVRTIKMPATTMINQYSGKKTVNKLQIHLFNAESLYIFGSSAQRL